jgi:two-component system phosphate regulon response regulator PhoB
MDHDNLEIRAAEQEAWLDGVRLPLSESELRLLTLLAGHPEQAFQRSEIVELLHGTRFASTPRAVDVLVCALRKKLGPAAERIEAVRNVGYRFRAPREP